MLPGTDQLVVRRITSDAEGALAALFQRIKDHGDDRFFHPHAFDERTAAEIAHYGGKDLYVAASLPGNDALVGYGMLRGWDAGYTVPSLGIIIDADARGRGLARLLMQHLHQLARDRGASQIRLKVYPSNAAAVSLYKSLGYQFIGEEHGQLVGVLAL